MQTNPVFISFYVLVSEFSCLYHISIYAPANLVIIVIMKGQLWPVIGHFLISFVLFVITRT